MKRRKGSKRVGSQEEEYLQEKLKEAIPDLSATCNSGAMHGNCDLGTKDFLVEVKSTVRSSYSVRNDLVKSIVDKGWEMGKKPILAVITDTRSGLNEENCFIVFPLDFAVQLLSTYNDARI